jgi:hypothetical protein
MEAPQVLPLSGEPRLIIVGREVRLGSGYAGLVAIESTGRIAIIEIELAANAESRRAVIAQVLAYAAFLDQASFDEAEAILEQGLRERGAGRGLATPRPVPSRWTSTRWSFAALSMRTCARAGAVGRRLSRRGDLGRW